MLYEVITRQYLVPYFREGDYSQGIFAASLAVINIIATNAGVDITGMPRYRGSSAYPGGSVKKGKPSLLGALFTIRNNFV